MIASYSSLEDLVEFVERVPAGVAMLNEKMCYVSVNSRWASSYRLNHLELVGRSHYEVFPEISDYWRQAHHEALSGKLISKRNDSIERIDGTTQTVSWALHPWAVSGSRRGILIFTEHHGSSSHGQTNFAEQVSYDAHGSLALGRLPDIITMCAQCKSVRDDQGWWRPVEHIIKRDNSVRISHGYCPTCLDKILGDFEDRSK